MLILLHNYDLDRLPSDTSADVKSNIREIIATLDNLYGADRAIADDGGYVVYLCQNDNIEEALKEIDINLKEDTPEHVDIVGNHINVLYLFNNKYGVNLFMPKSVAPKSLLDEL